MDVAFTDYVQPDLSIEHAVAKAAGLALRDVTRPCRTEAEVIAQGAGAFALVAQEAPLTRRVLESLPGLRIISMAQVGTNAVDLLAARDLGIWVTNVPDANATEVASHATAMAYALVRGLPTFDRAVRGGSWAYTDAGILRRPSTLTVGILGLGRIGRLFAARMAPGFGPLIAYDPVLPPAAWPQGIGRCDSVTGLLAAADIVSIHLPLTGQTAGLINASSLAAMRPGSILINVSRGGIVDTAALCRALDQGPLAAAGLDVLPTEPPDPADPALRHPRILLSPHAAFFSTQSDEETRRRSIETIATFLRTGRPDDVVVEGRR